MPVRVAVQLDASNSVAADPHSVATLLQVQHKVSVVRGSSATTTTIPARDVLFTAIDDDAPGVVSFTPNVYRAYELQVQEGDDVVRGSQRYELRATQCRVSSSGNFGPLYTVRPFLVDATTDKPVAADVGELRLYEVNAASGEMVRVPASRNGTLQIGGGGGARSVANGCRAFVEVVFKRDFQQLGERLYFVRHTLTSLDSTIAPLLAQSPSCPPIATPRDIAVVVRDSDTAAIDVQPLFERVQVIEGRVSSAYSVRLSKRPIAPVNK